MMKLFPILGLTAGLCLTPTLAAADPITPMTYAFSGTLSTVSSFMDVFMPGLTEGMAFHGTMSLGPFTSNEAMSRADLHIETGGQIINGWSFGLDPMAHFANYVPAGSLSSPTMQNGYVDNMFFEFFGSGSSLGTTGFYLMGRDPVTGWTTAGHAIGNIESVTTVPEPGTILLSLVGLGGLLARRRRSTTS